MSVFEIEKGIPVPTTSGAGEYRETIMKMVDGDSVWFPNDKKAKGFARSMRDLGFEVKMEKQRKDDVWGMRVWKVKKKIP